MKANVYIYHDSWQELLTLIYYLLKEKRIPESIYNAKNYEPNLLEHSLHLNIKMKNIERKFQKKLTPKIYKILYSVYLSNHPRKELIIYYFIKNTIKYGSKIIYLRNLNCVNNALSISKYVYRETHLFKGFLRFKEMENNFYYAEIEPENNILELLSIHFEKRFQNQNWMIKDTKRKIYVLYDQNKKIFKTEEDIIKLNLVYSNTEEQIEELWKTFFKTIAIKERENKKAQQNFMPKKYWKNMIEMESVYETNNNWK